MLLSNHASYQWWALGALALATLTVGLDGTVLSVALPTLATDLDASTSDLQWFTNAYLRVLAAALLPAGMLGDRYGRKRMLVGGLALFGLASAACAYATSTGELIAARAALGLGAAVLIPLSMAVLTVLFDDGQRPRALTVWITANGLGIPLGPLVGGWLLDHFWWGSVFLINLPLVAVALVAVVLLVPESRGAGDRRLDLGGVVLSAVGLVALSYGLVEAGERGWDDTRSLLIILVGVLILVALVSWQRHAREPLVDLDLFRAPAFTWGAVLATISMFAMFGLLFALPQLFQAVDGTDALGTGVRLLPVIGGLLVGARLADRIVPKAGTKIVITGGLALMAVALFVGAATTVGSGYGYVAAWITAAGMGLGLTMPPAIAAALGVLAPERSGVGSAVIQTMRQVGSAVGVAVLGTVLNSGYRGAVDLTGLPDTLANSATQSATAGVAVATRLGSADLLASVRTAFLNGMDTALLVSGGVALLGVLLALRYLPGRAAPLTTEHEPAAAESVA